MYFSKGTRPGVVPVSGGRSCGKVGGMFTYAELLALIDAIRSNTVSILSGVVSIVFTFIWLFCKPGLVKRTWLVFAFFALLLSPI